MKALYTAEATAQGGRDGKVESSDGVLKLALATPKELGGPGGAATNPEQLFAAGYSACFESAIRHVARGKKIPLTAGLSVTGEVGIGQADNGVGFALAVALRVHFNDLDPQTSQSLVNEAHKVCPYSNATRNNIDVKISIE